MSVSPTQREKENQSPALPLEVKTAGKAEHLLFLDGLRALAALFVVMHHSWLEIWPLMYHKSPHGLMKYLTGWLLFGHYAVALFIVLSGFSLMLSVLKGGGYLRGGVKTFFARRARRILPPYYFALALSLLLVLTVIAKPTGTHWDTSVGFGKRDVVHYIFLMQDILGAGAINHAFWSIAVECHYYLLFPLLVWGGRKCGYGAATCAAFVVSVIGMKIAHLPSLVAPFFPFFTLFALGMFGAEICYSERNKGSKLRDGVPWLALTIAFLLIAARIRLSRFSDYADFPFGLACFALLVAVGKSPSGRIRAALSWRPLAFLGGFSYSLYLIHAPLIQLFWQYILHPLNLGENATFFLLEFTGTPLIVVIAYGFYWFCERPFLTPALKRSAIAKGE